MRGCSVVTRALYTDKSDNHPIIDKGDGRGAVRSGGGGGGSRGWRPRWDATLRVEVGEADDSRVYTIVVCVLLAVFVN